MTLSKILDMAVFMCDNYSYGTVHDDYVIGKTWYKPSDAVLILSSKAYFTNTKLNSYVFAGYETSLYLDTLDKGVDPLLDVVRSKNLWDKQDIASYCPRCGEKVLDDKYLEQIYTCYRMGGLPAVEHMFSILGYPKYVPS